MNAHEGTKNIMNGSTFLTMQHDAHRRRRAAVSPFFSKRSIRNMDQLVRDKVERLMDRYHTDYTNGKVVNLSTGNSALALDVISSYCFGEGMQALNKPDYGKFYRDLFEETAKTNPISRQFPTFVNFVSGLPPWLNEILNPVLAPMLRENERLMRIIRTILEGKDDQEDVKHRTIFHGIKDSSLPA